ncbi:hypothetical protein CEUSTIGMA_g9992.t1 [Chlamydomonas eustigma]|uniref:Ubiquitin-like domain-containing protein n=1 Tax=Chlamydomonas eustigma TaxID=1157962 RepID=A0A250XHU3_9CHLO|nr:hypothetical protein CEUSTIGMA_g9992.t1 [Chlamydomonas eustigma]|eukprot:GAX82566.1 hypothetical protein CEUSTIGMA_g9992.t1 [Chlamydomonas eustigma]
MRLRCKCHFQMSSLVKLQIKNPANHDAYLLDIKPEATLADLQQLLADSYSGNPPPHQQTLIFAGKVLRDTSASIKSLVDKHGPVEGPHTFHLVIKKVDTAPSTGSNVSAASKIPANGSGIVSNSPSTLSIAAASASSTSHPPPLSPPLPPTSSSIQSTNEHQGASYVAPANTQEAPPLVSSTPFTSPTTQAGPHLSGGLSCYTHLQSVYNAAYEAAYTAAAAAVVSSGSATSTSSSAVTLPSRIEHGQALPAMSLPAMMPMGCYMPVMVMPQPYYPMLMPQPSSLSVNQTLRQQQQYHAQQQQQDLQPLVAQLVQAGVLNGQEIRIEGLPHEAIGPLALALAQYRVQQQQQRGRAGAGLQLGNNGAAAAAGALNVPRVRRMRLNIRLSMRALLQVLFFGMLMYQHLTWQRFMSLLIGGALMYIATRWQLPQYLAVLQRPPPQPPAQVPVGPAAAAAPAPGPVAPQGVHGEAPAQPPGDAGMAAAPVQAAPVPRGVVHELLVLILGLFTSLLPSWNYNPEDAAAFAVGQAIAAREEGNGQADQRGDAAGAQDPQQGPAAADNVEEAEPAAAAVF